MNGIQYYWTIAIGLIVGLILSVTIGLSGGIQFSDPMLAAPILLAYLYVTIAIFVVLLEIWDRFGVGVAILALIVAPTIIVYWFSRIGVIPSDR